MRKLFFLIFLFSISTIGYSQNWFNSSHFWSSGNIGAEFSFLDDQVTIEDAIYDNKRDVYYVSGRFVDSLVTETDSLLASGLSIFLAKFDSNFNLNEIRQIDGNSGEGFTKLALDSKGNLYLGGVLSSSNCNFHNDTSINTSGKQDVFIAKYHPDNSLQWVKNVGQGDTVQNQIALKTDNDNNVVFSVFYTDSARIRDYVSTDTLLYSIDSSGKSTALAKINGEGEILNLVNLPSNKRSEVINITTNDNNYYLSGRFEQSVDLINQTIQSTNDTRDVFIYKLDDNFSPLWLRRSYGNDHDYTGSLVSDEFGNVYQTGFFESSDFQVDSTGSTKSSSLYHRGNWDIFILKYSEGGDLQWAKSYGTSQDDWSRQIAQNRNILYITGYHENDIGFGSDTLYHQGGEDFFVGSFDTDGNKLRAFGLDQQGSGDESGVTIDIAPDNSVYVGGYFTSNSIGIGDTTFNLNGSQDMFLGRFTSDLAATFSEIQQPSCHGSSDGKLVAKPEFGVTPYTNYSWSPDVSSDSTAEGLSAGEYTVTITDAVDSTVTISHTLEEPDPIVFNGDTTNIEGCYGDSTGAIALNPSGGTTPYEHFWTTQDGGGLNTTAEDQSGLAAGTYTDTLTDANGCQVDTTITLTQPTRMSFEGTTVDHITNADPQGAVDLTATGATDPYQGYSWSGPEGFTASTEDISSLDEGGPYQVTVTDNNSCQFDTTVQVVDSTQLDVFFHEDSIEHVSCYGGNDGRAIVTAIQPETAPTYTWSPDTIDTNDSLAYNLAAGTYEVTVDDGDTAITKSVTINQPNPLEITFTGNSTSSLDCNGDADGIIDIDVSGGTSSYAYSWSTGSTQEDLNNLSAGTYEVTVTDANGCTVTASYTISEPDPLSASVLINSEISCYGFSDGKLEATVTGGTGPNYTYQWDDGASQTTRIADGLSEGTYEVTVTDENGCTAADSRTLTQPDSIQIDNYYSTDISCNGASDGEVHLSASGGSGTKWYTLTPEGGSGNTNTEGDFTGLSPGNYTVSVSDDNSCPGPEVKDTITEPAPLSINLVESTNITGCHGDATGSINVDADGGNGSLTYTLKDNGGSTVGENGNGEFTGLTAGTYTVEVDDSEGCGPITTSDIVIDEPAAIDITNTSASDASCNGGSDGSITVTSDGGTGTHTYLLKPDSVSNTSGDFTGLDAGTYTVEVTDENNCGPVETSDLVIGEPQAINVTVNSSSDVSCNGGSDGSLSVSADGGTGTLTYTLYPGGTNSNETGDFSNLSAGTYHVEVTDTEGCGPVSSSDVVIDQPSQIQITNVASQDATCNGCGDGSITVSADGGTGTLYYTLQPDSITNTSGEFTGLDVGTYTVDVSDDNGCGPVTTSDIGIGEPSEVTIVSSSATNVNCHGNSDGTISVDASGGNQPLIYTLQPDGLENNDGEFSGLEPGTYTVDVTDQGGYGPVSTSELVVGEPDPVSIASTSTTSVTCNGGSDGAVNVTASGGSGRYEYTLDPTGATDSLGNFTNLTADTYTVEVYDNNGCGPANTTDLVVSEPAAITVDDTSFTDVTCNGGADASISVEASGGSGTLTYTLQPDNVDNNSGDFTGLDAGTYHVEVNDAEGCGPVATDDMVIDQPTSISIASISRSDITCHGGNNGSITVSANGGSGSYNYTLLPNDTTNSTGEFTGLDAGTYNVEVTDTEGCGPVTSSDIVLEQPTAITITDTSSTNVTCYGGADGTITVSASGGNGSLSYTLQPDNLTNSQGEFANLDAGTYTVEVFDSEGCGPVATDEMTITQPSAIEVTSASTTPVTCHGGSDGAITVAAQGGTGTLDYTLQPVGTDNTTGEFTNLDAGNYTVTVTDANGCSSADTALHITQPDPITFDNLDLTHITTCASNANGAINVSASGGTSPMSYTLLPDNVSNETGEFTSLDTGRYTIEATDANTCSTIDTTVELTGPEPIAINNISVKNVLSCARDANGSIEVDASGGTGTLTYTLNPGNVSNFIGEFTGLTGGTYTLEITDENNCGPVDTTVEVTAPDSILINNVSSTDITGCYGDTTGSIQVDASGGSGSLSYTLNPGNVTNSDGQFNSLGADTYRVEVTDAHNCGPISTQAITLEQPEPLTIDNIDTTHVSMEGAADGTITASASGGTAPLTYILNPDSVKVNETGEFTGLAADDYRVVVTDINNCGPDTSSTIEIVVGPDTGNDELDSDYGLNIYPNPAHETVQIAMQLKDKAAGRPDIQIRIINTAGQLQKVIRFNADQRQFEREVNISSFKGGVYILKFFTSEQYLGQRKLIISR